MNARYAWILLAIPACEEPDHWSAQTNHQNQNPNQGSWFFAAGMSAPRVGDRVRLALCCGDLAAPSPLGSRTERFDPFVMRLGGAQQNELQLDFVDGRAGVTLGFEQPGDAIVAFSTAPHAEQWNGELVQFVRHAKTLLRVVQDPRDGPEPFSSLFARIGLRLELTPMQRPYGLLAGDALPVRVNFDGPALPGATLRVQHVPLSGAPTVTLVDANDSGVAQVPIGGPGRYAVLVVHPLAGSPRELHEATLTFELGVP